MVGYEFLDEIARGARHALCRGRRLSDGAPVLLKTAFHSPPRAADVEQMRREMDLLSGLGAPGVARAIELTSQEGRVCLVLRDPGGQPLGSLILSRRMNLSFFLPVATRLCNLLGGLHRDGIIHRNVNPAAFLVHPDSLEVVLVDLGLATREGGSVLPEADEAAPRDLTYVSPEQTGRMNRSVDHRSDLYSLGILLYEMLTGSPPFRSDDALEQIHWHIARKPVPPADADPGIPGPISDVVMRLLAKTAEGRYQSAEGVREDLERCARQWSERGAIEAFPLAQKDVPNRFVVSQTLYGRERELERLQAAFETVCDGPAALMLVGGYSGIGKTSLIQELYKPIVRRRGAFIAGKFDQVVRNVPYGALIQAFRGLARRLLAESPERLAVWRASLLEALGSSGGIITEVIPEAELILGQQPRPQDLPPAEAQNRFQLAFQNFVGCLARPDHPLVVFLDDLQWIDAATLSLLAPLLGSPDLRHLLLIGAYRDNEVGAGHPLARAIEELRSAGARVDSITLGPLQAADLTRLVSDSLHGTPDDAAPLSGLVMRKTLGNPFFVIQFLRTLHDEGMLQLDARERRWTYRIDEILGAAMTDNVIDLMTRKIHRLSPETQRMLTLAACIGNRFDLPSLGIVGRQTQERASEAIAEAAGEGLVMPDERAGSYTFLHDRVQQAAYAMIPEGQRPVIHLAVGRLLRDTLDPAAAEGRIFDLAHHLNLGSELIDDPAERLSLARLNLAAGRKAKSSTAFAEAVRFLRAGVSLLEAEHWASDYDLTFALHTDLAECLYLSGGHDDAERAFRHLLSKARSRLDLLKVHSLRTSQCENMARYADAVVSAREGLEPFGITFPRDERGKADALARELLRIDALRAGRPIDALAGLPLMRDPEIPAVLRLLTIVWAPAYISGDAPLTRLISALIVRLSLEFGNTQESAYGYVTHAITVGPIGGDYQAAYEWGRLALAVTDRFENSTYRAKVNQQFHAHVNLWRRPFVTCIPYAREACRSGLQTGDFTYAGYGAFTESWPALPAIRALEEFVQDCSATLPLLQKFRTASLVEGQKSLINFARALQGLTRDRLSLDTDDFDEAGHLRRYGDQPFFMTIYHVAKLYLCVLFAEPEEALQAARNARRFAHALEGTLWPVLLDFLEGLTVASLAGRDASGPTRDVEEKLASRCDAMGRLAASCPENYLCWALLLEAELRRLQRRERDALRLYQEAVRQARATGNLANEALASELIARYWIGEGNDRVAALYLEDARALYARWGAAAKARDLERRHPGLLAAPADAVEHGASALDLATITKAAHAIAEEIVLDDLLRTLVRIAIENAGARRGLFIQEVAGRLALEAEGSVEREEVTLLRSAPLDDASAVCRSVVQYVRATGESVIVSDAATDDRFASDPYVARAAPRSILCVPVIHQGRSSGILYLENNLAADAFTSSRVRVMQILSSQAAISLENARLYDEMKQEVARRVAVESDLRDAVAELERLKDRLQADNVLLQEEIRTEHNFAEMVGSSPALLDLLARVEKVAPTDATVLICGETGTGKELIARAVHSHGARKDRPLAKVNCGAISPGLVESELFGHVKGAYTGAIDRRVGRFELAHGGTLFLDEVGELPLETQVKLLRVLEEQEFEPVGSSRSLRVDVRIIAATNRDLEEAVRAGRFRADLYFRLNVLPLVVPPLRERASDIPQLVTYFLARFSKRFGKQIQGVSRETMDLLTSYSWPGNVRELLNIIERAVVLTKGSVLVLGPDLLPRDPRSDGAASAALALPAARPRVAPPEPSWAGPASLEEIERRHILAMLSQTGGVIEGPRGAARILALHPNTLRSRMKKLGIRKGDLDTSA